MCELSASLRSGKPSASRLQSAVYFTITRSSTCPFLAESAAWSSVAWPPWPAVRQHVPNRASADGGRPGTRTRHPARATPHAVRAAAPCSLPNMMRFEEAIAPPVHCWGLPFRALSPICRDAIAAALGVAPSVGQGRRAASRSRRVPGARARLLQSPWPCAEAVARIRRTCSAGRGVKPSCPSATLRCSPPRPGGRRRTRHRAPPTMRSEALPVVVQDAAPTPAAAPPPARTTPPRREPRRRATARLP